MPTGSNVPSRWETKKIRTPRLTRDQLAEKLNVPRKSETDDEDSPGDDVNDGSTKKAVTSRSSAKKIGLVVNKFCPYKKRLISQIGFDGILQISQINKLDRTFSLELLKMVNCKNHTIQCGKEGALKITPEALQRVLGIPCGTIPVCGMEDDSAEEKLDFIRICIGTGVQDDDEHEDAKIYDSLEAAEYNVMREYPHGMSRTEEEQFKVSFIVFLVCRFLCPMSQPNSGSKSFWGSLLDPNNIGHYNWCGFVVDNIVESARKVQYTLESKGVVTNVGGCSLALQVLFIDYLRFGTKNNKGVRLPRISDYTCSTMSKLINVFRSSNTQTCLQELPEVMTSQLGASTSQKDAVGANISINQQKGAPPLDIPATDSTEKCEEAEPSVSSFNTAVTATKLPMRQKIALRYFMARMVNHINIYKSSVITEGIKLAQKLDNAVDTESVSSPKAYAVPNSMISNNSDGRGRRSPMNLEGNTRQNSRCKNPDDPFDLGIDWEHLDSPAEQVPSIPQLIFQPKGPLSTEKLAQSRTHASVRNFPMRTQGYSSDPESSRSVRPTPFQYSAEKSNCTFKTPTNLYVGNAKSSPSIINRNWSESALLLRVFEDEENAKIGGKRLSFEFTDTPVKKRICTTGRIAKAPWGQRLTHSARNPTIISSFSEWIKATSSPDLSRIWIIHSTPRYIEVSGAELKQMVSLVGQLSYNLFDIGVRRLSQLDARMFHVAGAQVWRTILESDFAMMVLAECSLTNNTSVRTQFLGSQILHEIKNCRMIAVTALVRETWCSYYWDMKLRLVHVIDPLFDPAKEASFLEIHDPNVAKIQAALATCVNEFFECWSPDWADWKRNYVAPMIPNANPNLSGILTLIALRDFNGVSFCNEQNKHVVTSFADLLLYEVLAIGGNEAKLPENFIKPAE